MTNIDAQQWFERWFYQHYPSEIRSRYLDAMTEDANPANNPSLYAHIADGAERFVHNASALFDVTLTFDGEGVAKLARALDRTTRDRLANSSDPSDPSNALFNTIVHGALFVGECAVRAHGCQWSARNPLWESRVRRFLPGKSPKELAPFAPFQWLLKHLDDREIDDSKLYDRFKLHVEHGTLALDRMSVLTERNSLPSLKHPAYDTLIKYLHTHLPSVRDLGGAFPTASEFTAIAYDTVGFEVLEQGRVIAMHGMYVPSDHDAQSTVDVHWLTSEGVLRIDRIPCDRKPPHFARRTGDHLEVTYAHESKPRTHRLRVQGHG
ncbi:MAG: hypothetical protein Q8Q09_08040 [Deltaproteobacteria bacterium]|nr:hypothetical protein [Deltaproteobacteria bacterium]